MGVLASIPKTTGFTSLLFINTTDNQRYTTQSCYVKLLSKQRKGRERATLAPDFGNNRFARSQHGLSFRKISRYG